MKIVYLSDDFPPQSFGGAGIVACQLAKGMQSRGHEVSIITTVRSSAEAGIATYDGLTIYKIYSNYHERWRAYVSLYNFLVVRQVARLLKILQPDIVHAHNVHQYLSYGSLQPARRYAQGVFLTAHDAMSFAYGKVLTEEKLSFWQTWRLFRWRFNPVRNIIIKIFLHWWVDKIMAVSDSLRRSLINNGLSNVVTIRNGIRPGDWVTTPEAIEAYRATLGLSPASRVVLFGGRLSAMKGGQVVIEALKSIVAKVPAAVLLVAGPCNEYAVKMSGQAAKLGLADKIIFTGWLEPSQMKLVYGLAEVVVVASLYVDPLVIINLEAQSAGRPVVGTNLGGTQEVVENDKTGYIVNPYQVDELATKITDLLLNPDKARRFGQAGQERVVKFFSAESQLDQTLVWYDKVTKRSYE